MKEKHPNIFNEAVRHHFSRQSYNSLQSLFCRMLPAWLRKSGRHSLLSGEICSSCSNPANFMMLTFFLKHLHSPDIPFSSQQQWKHGDMGWQDCLSVRLDCNCNGTVSCSWCWQHYVSALCVPPHSYYCCYPHTCFSHRNQEYVYKQPLIFHKGCLK